MPTALLRFKRVRTPSIEDLVAPLRRSARGVAERLREGGRGGWIVGGAVRDLALGRVPTDVDLATDALPDQVEELFERTAAVGKAFGTVLVLDFDVEVQVTTLRAEGQYSDGRRPDEVRYADTIEEDARRRDFTCNALYLDPLTNEITDPEGGLADLRAGILRCVGKPSRRFAEDGLRILRLARFAASYGLGVEEETRAAAATSLDSLRGVSPERVYGELERILGGPDPILALELLHGVGALGRLLPGWEQASGDRLGPLRAIGADAGRLAWFAALTGCEVAPLEALRAPRAVTEGIQQLGRLAPELEGTAKAQRSERVRLIREPVWEDLLALARASGGARGAAADALEALRSGLAENELRPRPLLLSTDLAAAGVPRGPRWGTLLLELETQQLNLTLRTREEALAWLERER